MPFFESFFGLHVAKRKTSIPNPENMINVVLFGCVLLSAQVFGGEAATAWHEWLNGPQQSVDTKWWKDLPLASVRGWMEPPTSRVEHGKKSVLVVRNFPWPFGAHISWIFYAYQYALFHGK
jgi:hypothetical protein